VNVLRHHDVAGNVEIVFLAHPFKRVFEERSCLFRSKERRSLITTEGDEVEVTCLLISDQTLRD
jgi:hypothetical protein